MLQQDAIGHHRRVLRTLIESGRYRLQEYRQASRRNPHSNEHRLVSIVIPTLSKGRHEGRLQTLHALLSRFLPKQTYGNFEAIVVSDGPNPRVRALVETIADPRIVVRSTAVTSNLWGHPETRLGLSMARGDFFVRMNDDNRPFPWYLESLLDGFEAGSGVTYGRVVFSGEARQYWRQHFSSLRSYILPNDAKGTLYPDNYDCMCAMTRTDLARQVVWGDTIDADWLFLESLIQQGFNARFVNRLIGIKC